jgi:hypothetical protein
VKLQTWVLLLLALLSVPARVQLPLILLHLLPLLVMQQVVLSLWISAPS